MAEPRFYPGSACLCRFLEHLGNEKGLPCSEVLEAKKFANKSPSGNPDGLLHQVVRLLDDLNDLAGPRLHDDAPIVDHRKAVVSMVRNRP